VSSTFLARTQGTVQSPTIIARSPSRGATLQAVSTKVAVTFSEAIQPASMFFVLKDSSNTVVPVGQSYDASAHSVTLVPKADLVPSRTYTVSVSGALDLAGAPMASPDVWSFSTGQPGFVDSEVFRGLDNPTAFQFAADGRVFVAQKDGIIVVFDGPPTIFADLRANVDSSGNGGLMGMALDPKFPAKPYVYVLYTHRGLVGGARLSRLQADGNRVTGTNQVLIKDGRNGRKSTEYPTPLTALWKTSGGPVMRELLRRSTRQRTFARSFIRNQRRPRSPTTSTHIAKVPQQATRGKMETERSPDWRSMSREIIRLSTKGRSSSQTICGTEYGSCLTGTMAFPIRLM
jgi:methionine-rich copper-binding protein CopC